MSATLDLASGESICESNPNPKDSNSEYVMPVSILHYGSVRVFKPSIPVSVLVD